MCMKDLGGFDSEEIYKGDIYNFSLYCSNYKHTTGYLSYGRKR